MTPAAIKAYVKRAASNDASYNDEAKHKFLSGGRTLARHFAKALGLKPNEYDVIVSPGGIAVSGEVTLSTDFLYLQISQGTGHLGLLYRGRDGRKDWGSPRWPNHWVSWKDVGDDPQSVVDRLAKQIKQVKTRIETEAA